METEKKLKPFLKYVGGKTKLLHELLLRLPDSFNNYYEPFVGGGSVLFELINKKILKHNINVSDINKNLIDVYITIRNNPSLLILELKKDIYKNEKTDYLKNRDRYNCIKDTIGLEIEKAALFIYLNKCGFNGMYRENSNGKFNIPFGKQKNPTLIDETLIMTISKNLNNDNDNISINCYDYKNIKNNILNGDFVYIDSPYHGTFTEYTKNKFGEKEQIELKDFVDTMTKMNVKVMLSNSATDFIKDLYKDYTQFVVSTKYVLNSKSEERKKIKEELIIVNY